MKKLVWVLGLTMACATGVELEPKVPEDTEHGEEEIAPLVMPIGAELSVPRHLQDGDELELSTRRLIAHGKQLLAAAWTVQEGGGRPLTKGVGAPLTDPSQPLEFPRNFNRVSAPDANSCSGCHAQPFGIVGGGGDIVANVFVLGHRFDFATFDPDDNEPTRGAVDERGETVTLQTIANSRNTLGMFGSGYIEMLARQMTAELQATRDELEPGESAALSAKGVSFGVLARTEDGTWDTTGVEGLPHPSVTSEGPDHPPNLIIRPFHQAGAVVSLREFTNNAFNHHHGIQSNERFGDGTDPDGDGFIDELTRADVTAAAIMQATMAVPGRVIPRNPEIEQAVRLGEDLFVEIGCASCHVPALPLTDKGWVFSEPNPYNPPGNLQVGEREEVRVNLNSRRLPSPRLRRDGDTTWVPAFTDLKLHHMTCGEDDPNREPLDMTRGGSPELFDGNDRFITRKLWGTANEPPYYHHGQFTTLRQAVLAHCGDALESREDFEALSSYERDAVIEFLKTLQILKPGTPARVVDHRGRPRHWRTFPH